MKRVSLVIPGLLVVILIGIVVFRSHRSSPGTSARVIAAEPPMAGFARATGPTPLSFPETHGPHPDYQTEWWYYTGNLDTDDGRHFGYQLTFFRRALIPPDQWSARSSDWATNQIYFAHFALTDVSGSNYQSFERFGRGTAGIAGAQAEPYKVWIENWQVELVAPDSYHLHGEQDGIVLDLTLDDLKGPVLQGDRGYSQKGPQAGNASYYYSLTRLRSQGTIGVNSTSYDVAGLSWMDHEYSTSALSPDEVGWDWFALQLDDGSEVMMFQLRHADGTIDPFSGGTFVAPDGSVVKLSAEDFRIKVEQTWHSSRSGGNYPAKWTVEIPSQNIVLRIEPYLADQELTVSFTYWEGAVKIQGQRGSKPLAGSGYIELTGYAGSMVGQF